MTILIGNLALVAALLFAAGGLVAAVGGGKLGSPLAMRLARLSLSGLLAMFTLAGLMLLGALVDSDFRLNYVSRFTEKALPLGYKLAAFWAGQEGSLLLWGWMLAACSTLAAFVQLRNNDKSSGYGLGVMLAVCGFFAALMLFAANPFVPVSNPPADGQGLNPMLQDPAMIWHPPALFAGYAGFVVPFAMMLGALWAGRTDSNWLGAGRRWVIASWLFLTIGILLGAQWAYVELGWGGYWAWDPVENASLLPWLISTALLHSMMVQQQRGMLKGWNAGLVAGSFILCIFGTWITRSGIVDSVHGFGKSMVGVFFFVFQSSLVVLVGVTMLVRRRLLAAENKLETPWGREGMFLLANALLVVMTLVTAVGTLLPAITQLLMGRQISVQQPFYNKVVIPMAVVLMAMMAVGPLLGWGKTAGQALAGRVRVPLGVGATAAAVLLVLGVYNPWALVCGMIVGVSIGSAVADFGRGLKDRMSFQNENAVVAAIRLIDGNHRRYGGQVVHVGTLMILAGIAGSSVYGTKHDLVVSPGKSAAAGKFTAQLVNMEQVRKENYTAVQATVTISGLDGFVRTLTPQRRFYDKSQDGSNSEVAINSDLSRDVYVALAGWEDGGKVVALQVLVNPLVAWLWIGGVVMSIGAIVCMLPRFLPQGVTVAGQTGMSAPPKRAEADKNVCPT